jgi:hypothetical protein
MPEDFSFFRVRRDGDRFRFDTSSIFAELQGWTILVCLPEINQNLDVKVFRW